jgi:hypothetical protein
MLGPECRAYADDRYVGRFGKAWNERDGHLNEAAERRGSREQQTRKDDRRVDRAYALCVKEQGDMAILNRRLNDRDFHVLANDFRANFNLCERGAISHARIGGATLRPVGFKSCRRAFFEAEAAEGEPDIPWVPYFELRQR